MNRRTTRTLIAVAVATIFAFVFVHDVQGSPKRAANLQLDIPLYTEGASTEGAYNGEEASKIEKPILYSLFWVYFVCVYLFGTFTNIATLERTVWTLEQDDVVED